jgi:hypothetical protein
MDERFASCSKFTNPGPFDLLIAIVIVVDGWDCVSVELRRLAGPLSIPQMTHEQQLNDITGENQQTRRKACPSATLSTKNPAWTTLDTNLSLLCEKPATNRLS